eukprot:5915347-Lingulodinium_polyedra.AAC.1
MGKVTGVGGGGGTHEPTAIDVESNSDGMGASESEGEDNDELGEDFDQTYSHVMNALEQLEQQAEAIGRRAVEIDRLPGGSERPSVVAA